MDHVLGGGPGPIRGRFPAGVAQLGLPFRGVPRLQCRQAAGPPAFQSRDWRSGLAMGTAGAMGWPGFRDAALDDEATGAWLN